MTDSQLSLMLSSATVGDVIRLGDRSGDSGVLLCEGSTGLMGIPRSTRYQEGAGDGGRRLGSRAKVRPLLLKLAVHGSLGAQRALIDRLRRIVLAEDATLTATIDGVSWTLGVSYDNGLEGDYALSKATSRLTLIDLAMTAPQPFWEAASPWSEQYSVMSGGEPFLPELAGLHVAGSSLGDGVHHVDITSDAPMPVTVDVTGPADTVGFSIGGVGWTSGAVASGSHLRVWRSEDGLPMVQVDGKDAWATLRQGPRFPLLQPGGNDIDITVTGAAAATRSEDTGTVAATNLVTDPALRKGACKHDTGEWSWSHPTGAQHGTMTLTRDGALHACWVEVAKPASGWPDGGLTAVVGGWVQTRDGKANGTSPAIGGLTVGQYDASGALLCSIARDDTADGAYKATFAPQPGCARIRVGAYGEDCSQVSLIGLISGADSWFDGNTTWCAWTGAADASTSVMHGTTYTGGTSVRVEATPLKETVR